MASTATKRRRTKARKARQARAWEWAKQMNTREDMARVAEAFGWEGVTEKGKHRIIERYEYERS